MGLDLVPTGQDVPHDINVVIEIPKDAEPVKYEVDKATGAIFVDRVLSTPMRYPCNYGYVPHTLCGDGDPVDVLVVMPLPLIPGSVIRCRPVGMLNMTDEAGTDTKLIAVPIDKVFPGYAGIRDIGDLRTHPELAMVQHVDGFGTQGQKLDTYHAVLRPRLLIPGFKLFYDEDIHRMGPAAVHAIRPKVRFVSFQ